MAQLTTLDAGFLKAEAADQHASLALGAVAVLKGAVPDYDRLKMLLAERIREIPEWVDYPAFDLAQHVRRVALPRPGDDAELFRAISHALERPLDLDRPPWECWIIEGLKGNRWAILLKIHPCMADGISAAHILTRLCDDADGDTFTNQAAVKQVSPPHTDTATWADALWQASTTVYKAAARAIAWPVTWISPTDQAVTMRQYRTVRVPRAAVDNVCRKFGVGTNDVALAAIAEGFRTVLLHRGEQPRADSLRTLEKTDNLVSAMLPYLPVEHDDPVQRLRTVHKRLNRKTPIDQRRTGGLLDYMPLMLCAKAIQALIRLPQQGIVTLATSAPGPRHRLRLLGQRMEQLLPIPPTTLQLSTGVAVLSYGDELVFGITADYSADAEMEQLATGIELGMARLVALSQDSVLLFTKDRRKRSSRALPTAQRRRPPAPPARARH